MLYRKFRVPVHLVILVLTLCLLSGQAITSQSTVDKINETADYALGGTQSFA